MKVVTVTQVIAFALGAIKDIVSAASLAGTGDISPDEALARMKAATASPKEIDAIVDAAPWKKPDEKNKP